jgi:hypothetical protein
MPSIHCSASQLVTDPCSHHSVSRYASRHRLRRRERLTRSSTFTLVAENRGHVARKLPCLSHTVLQRTNPAGRGHSVVIPRLGGYSSTAPLAMARARSATKGAQGSALDAANVRRSFSLVASAVGLNPQGADPPRVTAQFRVLAIKLWADH